MAKTETVAAGAASPDLGLTMTQILRHPLAALRAQMESLASEFRADDPRSTQLRGALEQVLKMSRDVEALVQLAAPSPVAPLPCSVDEILHSALRGLRFHQSSRVQVANAAVGAMLEVDGPLLADCLGRLIDNALANLDGWVLLSARVDGGAACFSLVEGVEDGSYSGRPRRELSPQRGAALELGHARARRDLERMGGTLRVTHTLLGNTCVGVRLPLAQHDAPRDR
jgi:K+-sensing histidine kinase KdpD